MFSSLRENIYATSSIFSTSRKVSVCLIDFILQLVPKAFDGDGDRAFPMIKIRGTPTIFFTGEKNNAIVSLSQNAF